MNNLSKVNRLLLEVSQSPVIDQGHYDQAAELICHTACKGLGIRRCSVWHLNKEHTEMHCIVLIQDEKKEEISITLSDKDFPVYFNTLKATRFIMAEDANTNPATKEFSDNYLRPLGITSMLDAPIRQSGKLIGILCCENIGPMKAWDELDQSFTGGLADILGRALTAQDHHKIKLELEQTNQHLEQLVEERTHHLETAHSQIAAQEKMAALGQLVAGIAHEINTPIGIGVTSVSHLSHITSEIKSSFNNGTITETQFSQYITSVDEGCNLLLDNLNRAAKLIRSFKQVAVDQTDDTFLTINLAETLNNIANSVRPELKKKHGTHIELECPEGIMIHTCPGSIAQVITNLLMNAGIHAFTETHNNRIVSIIANQEEKAVSLVIEDNGQGVSPDIGDRLFDPFVTTRRHMGGSGLGLNIVFNLITQKLKGKIMYETEVGKYTRFIITLPFQTL